MATVPKLRRSIPLYHPGGKAKGWPEKTRIQKQPGSPILQAVAVFSVVVIALWSTAWLLIDMLLLVAF